MCGIYGVINRKVRREQAMECLDTMIHRGPDGFGLWQEDGVTLGHRRLDIRSTENLQCSAATSRFNAINVTAMHSIHDETANCKDFFQFFAFSRRPIHLSTRLYTRLIPKQRMPPTKNPAARSSTLS